MKRLLVIATLLGALGLGAFLVTGIEPSPAHAGVESGDSTPVLAAAESSRTEASLPETSVYQLGSTWTNRRGEAVHLTELRDKPRLVAMVFTHCGYACPRIVQDLKTIVERLPEARRDAVGIVLVSIDPENDTPQMLRHFGERHELNETQWTLLRGEDEQVRALSAVLGVRYKQEADALFAHSNRITLLDADGEIVHRRDGLETSLDETVAAVRALLPEVGEGMTNVE